MAPETGERAGSSSVLATLRSRAEVGSTIKKHAPPLFALAGLAVTQPLLDLFGRNPEFFVASDLTRSEIVTFALAAAVLVPTLATLLVVVAGLVGGRRLASSVGLGLLGFLAFVFGLTIARQVSIDRTLGAVAIGGVVAAAVVSLSVRLDGFRQALRYLGLAPFAFLALFLFASESSALLFDAEAAAAGGVTVGDPAPVVVVVLDETPASSFMRSDGTLNEERFPNFARLADAGTWYRDATSVSPNTPNSLPTILDGEFPSPDALPTSADHPENLFTLLGGQYDLDVTETVTELCPSTLCVPDEEQSLGQFFDRLGQAFSDASVVYGHTSLPRRFRDDLPAVDQTWGGFVDDGAAVEAPAGDAPSDAPSDETQVEFLQRQKSERAGDNPELAGEVFREAFATSSVNDDNDLLFVHEVFPHYPWIRTPEGGVYENRVGPPGTTDGVWDDNEFLITQGLQRHLLQLGYADVALGDLIDKLQADGVWDDALVVVTADHGISFTEGQPRRTPTDDNVNEVYNVPLFIKAPGDDGGIVDDEPARTIDIVPTIVDLLDIESDFTFEGTSLLGPDRATDQPVVFGRGPEAVEGGVDAVIEIAERNADRFPEGDGWPAVAAIGRYGSLVGTPVADLDVVEGGSAVDWSLDESERLDDVGAGDGRIPLILTGQIDQSDAADASWLVALNGVAAGVVGFEDDEGGFSALLDESLIEDGANDVTLLRVSGSPASPEIRLGGPPQ